MRLFSLLFAILLLAATPAAALAQNATGPNGRPLGATPPNPIARVAADTPAQPIEEFTGSDSDIPGAYDRKPTEGELTSRSFLADGGVRGLHIASEAPANSFRLSPEGRVGFGIAEPRGRLHVAMTYEDAGSRDLLLLDDNGNLEIAGVLSEASSVYLKENIQPVDGASVLKRLMELPIATWNYTTESSGVQHMGPMAQDFRALFGLGSSDETIAVLDAAGVTMAAVQALASRVAAQDAVLEALRAQNADLLERLQALEAQK